MKSSILSVFVSIAWLVPIVSARTWANLVDSAIFLASAVDYGRLEKSLERDPFDFSDGHEITEAPTHRPTSSVEEAAESPTLAPTLVDSCAYVGIRIANPCADWKV
jgi:hypothetical protein